MMDVVMPQLGESVSTGTIARWLKAAGESIAVDEPLCEVSSDKVTMEVPSLVAGRIGEIVAVEGTEVAVGSVIARIAAATGAHPTAVLRSVPHSTEPSNGEPPGRRETPARGERPGRRERLSPVVRRLLRDHGLESGSLAGSAENGRITKTDVLARIAAAPNPVSTPPANPAPSRRVVFSKPQRRAIERLTTAQKSAVNVFSVVEVDMEAVVAERARRKLTYLPFIARAAVDALQEHPTLNASLDEANTGLVCHDAVHLGIAVDLAERGLVIPVVRHAEGRTLDALAAEIARLADGARALKLRPDEYTGSTFTLTNNGAFGTLMTAPVINAPNVAILSTDAVELRPVAIDRTIAVRYRMYLCMTWDHRAFDGSTAARFLCRVKQNLETWDWTLP